MTNKYIYCKLKVFHFSTGCGKLRKNKHCILFRFGLLLKHKINERINMNYHIEIKNKKQLDLLMQCIQKAYLPYGQEMPDEDVYAINCEIDEVMQQVKKAEYK